MDESGKMQLSLQASGVFTPAAPIRERDVFAGRRDQLRMVIDAINQPGQHALIYGERGVGKTSLANVLDDFVALTRQAEILAPHINCDASDDYGTTWRKIFRRVTVSHEQWGLGLRPDLQVVTTRLGDDLRHITPESVVDVCRQLLSQGHFMPIIDEFDRISDPETTRLFTDTVKALSDQLPWVSVVIVGVADTVEELMSEHRSVERAMVQVRMPRMSPDELMQIVLYGVKTLGMQIDESANEYIAALSQGLPHYTHLLGLHSTRAALDASAKYIELSHVDQAITKALEGSQQTLQRAYHQATMSHRSDAIYSHVLLACALAQTDQLGYFASVDVRDPLSRIMGKRYEIAAFSRHLSDFCNDNRGAILERTGVSRRYRFRFRNPLLQPFTIMQGLADGKITRDALSYAGHR